MKAIRAVAALVVAVMILTPLRLSAQNEPLKRSEVIPLDLATALVMSGGIPGSADPQILVGAIPEWIQPRVYVPAGSRVLGSAFLGSTVVGVINIPTWSDTIVKDLERAFMRLGWKKLPTTQTQSGGFLPAPVANPPMATSFSLCMDNQMLFVRTSRQSASANVVMRVSTSGSGFNPCVPRELPAQAERQPLPTLYDPVGATNRTDCYENMGGSYGGYGTGTRLRTTLTPDAVLEHYGRQLADSGWTIKPGVGMSIERKWTRPDSTGKNSEVTLTVKSSGNAAACLEVSLNVSNRPR